MHLHCCVRPSKFTPVTHVIFDLDGTIIDSEVVYCKALRQSVESYDREYSDDFITKVQGSVEMDVARVAIQTFNLDITPEEFVVTYNGFSNEFLGDLDLMPGSERLIRHLHKNNIPIAVATSSPQNAFELKTNKYSELFSAFHHVVCGGTDPEVKNGKPAPDIFLLAASRFDDPPEPSKCLVFEDSTNGLKAGLAAGMQVVMLPEHSISYDVWKLATLRLDSFNYIMPELFGLPPFPEEEMAQEFAAFKAPPTLGNILDDKNKEVVEAGENEKTITIGEENEDNPYTANTELNEENQESPEPEIEITPETENTETPEEETTETNEDFNNEEVPEEVAEETEEVAEETPEAT